MINLEGKVAVITGGARGIGEACAWELLSYGADVLLADINVEGAKQSSQRMSEKYAECSIRAFQIDVRKQAECFAMADYALEELGGFDILVNSAGIISPCPSLDVTETDWLNLISINLSGVFFCCQAAGRMMKNHGGGGIINISSIAAKAAWPGRTSYAAAKHGITGITESLAVEWASIGIRVNGVAPTWVNTELMQSGIEQGVVALEKLENAIPAQRIAEPEDIAKAVVFLASDNASMITGQILFVDGGFLSGAPTAAIR